MHVDLEIRIFADDISLYFAFAAAAAAIAEATKSIVSLFRVGAPFFYFDFFFFALHSSSSSSMMWDLVVGFLCILLDFLCGC